MKFKKAAKVDTNSTNGRIVGIENRRKISRKRLFLSLLIGLSLVSVAGFLLVKNQNKNKLTLADKCSPYHEQSITKPAGLLLAVDTGLGLNKLEEEIKRIQQERGYEEDPNCLYPIVRYHLYMS